MAAEIFRSRRDLGENLDENLGENLDAFLAAEILRSRQDLVEYLDEILRSRRDLGQNFAGVWHYGIPVALYNNTCLTL